MKKSIFFLLLLCLCLGLPAACGSKKRKSDCRTCRDFSTRAQAKSYAKSHPKCKRELDSDRDGIYCEELPK